MTKLKWMASPAAATVMSVSAQAQNEGQVESFTDFTLADETGISHQMSKYGYAPAVVIISQGNGCTANQDDMVNYKLLRSKWQDEGVEMLMMNSQQDNTRDKVRETLKVYNYDIPVMLDYDQLAADELGITQAGQVVVIDPTTRNILYRGPMDVPAEEELQEVLASVTEGEQDTRNMPVTEVDFEVAEGCELDLSAIEMFTQNAPDYETEIAPILIERCVGCHVEGGIAPFAMNSHQMVQGWSPMMKEVVMTKRMPPMTVDPDVGSWPINSYEIPVEERQKLIQWINAGSPRE